VEESRRDEDKRREKSRERVETTKDERKEKRGE